MSSIVYSSIAVHWIFTRRSTFAQSLRVSASRLSSSQKLLVSHILLDTSRKKQLQWLYPQLLSLSCPMRTPFTYKHSVILHSNVFFLFVFFSVGPINNGERMWRWTLAHSCGYRSRAFWKIFHLFIGIRNREGWESFAAVLHKDAVGQGECKGHGESEKVMFWL